VISFFLFFRLDMTEGKIYSLSDASKKIVAGLEDKVIVKCFFSDELPPQMKLVASAVRDNLEEYKAYSNGNFYYEFISPADEEFSKQIMSYQLPSAQVQMLEKDEFKVKKVFMGMVLIYEDKKEIIPFIQEGDLPALEYEITGKIRRLTTDRLPVVGILAEPGMTKLEDIRTVYQILSAQYVVSPVAATKEELAPDKLDALLIIGPKENFSQTALSAIDNYLTGGGKIGFFIDRTDVNLQMQNVKNIDTNLDSLMISYGVSVNPDLVGDKQAGIITMRQQKGFFSIANQIKYPFLPVITNLSRKNPVTQKIDAVSLYFASTIDTTRAEGKNLDIEIIARTSGESFVQSGSYYIMADRDINDYRYNTGHLPVIALVKGSFRSYFEPGKAGVDTRIAVAGDAEFFADNKTGSDENINLFLNITDWLTADETLISIRSKDITQRPLRKVSEGTRTVIKTLNIILIPLLFAAIGIFRWYSGRKRKDFSLK
jgi:gliding-associated putative ABC transporter substrate-binding component GldG